MKKNELFGARAVSGSGSRLGFDIHICIVLYVCMIGQTRIDTLFIDKTLEKKETKWGRRSTTTFGPFAYSQEGPMERAAYKQSTALSTVSQPFYRVPNLSLAKRSAVPSQRVASAVRTLTERHRGADRSVPFFWPFSLGAKNSPKGSSLCCIIRYYTAYVF